MPFPSLSEMMQAIQDSQQNAFIPAYQQAQQQKLEQDYKKQQMEKIMQEMRLTEDMHPLEMDSKRGATRLNNSSADINELSASTTRTIQGRPAYLSSIDANQNKSIAEADSAIHKSTQDNLKSQVAMEQAAKEMAFFNKPGSDAAASTSAEAWQNREQQIAQLKAAQIRANASGGGGAAKNPNMYSALENYQTQIHKANQIVEQYTKLLPDGSRQVIDPKYQSIVDQARDVYKLNKQMLDTLTVVNTSEDNPFGLPPQNKTVSKGSQASQQPAPTAVNSGIDAAIAAKKQQQPGAKPINRTQQPTSRAKIAAEIARLQNIMNNPDYSSDTTRTAILQKIKELKDLDYKLLMDSE